MALRTRRKEQIIYAAMNVFSKNGFEHSKMESIAIEAGIGKGTIYGYFSSKRELFEEMICFNMDEYKRELSKIIDSQDNFSKKLERWFNYHTSLVNQSFDIFQLIDSGKILSDSMKKKFIEEQKLFLELVEKMIENGIIDGEIRKNIDQEVAALCILGAINHFANKRIFMDKISVKSMDFVILIDILMEGLGR